LNIDFIDYEKVMKAYLLLVFDALLALQESLEVPLRVISDILEKCEAES
jgi:hypothetical protein